MFHMFLGKHCNDAGLYTIDEEHFTVETRDAVLYTYM